MRGEDWNTLVAAPSVTEIDAALAEVRLRAVPIARRQARNRRAARAMLGVLALGGAFWAGGLNGNGVRVGAGHRPWRATGYPGAPELVAGGTTPAPVRTEGHAVYRIRSWMELDGYRYDEGESWV